jgi:type I site-specific restriction endonuclease
MSIGDWILGFVVKIKQRKEEKRRKEFAFLLAELNASERRIVRQVTDQTANNIDTIHSQILDLQKQQEGNDNETKALLKSIMKKIEEAESNHNQLQEHNEEVVDDRSRSIILSIEEVKSLMQIIAVNNLVDDINIDQMGNE